ncbi:hypothetical protein NST81_13985 [Bacillus sp. FSL W8-0223]|uniref:hypothetical protein n=1 Tax=Bacillus sp. FSL W8-0223 TaxID=2954595 RepID=UPI000A7B0F31
MKSYTYGKRKKLQMIITDDYLRLLVTKKIPFSHSIKKHCRTESFQADLLRMKITCLV